MSRTKNTKKRGMRWVENKLFQSLLFKKFCDDVWHRRSKDRINSHLMRRRLKRLVEKEINDNRQF